MLEYNFIKFTKKGATSKIFDKFTELNVSRQRKWQLRNPEKSKEIMRRYSRGELKIIN